MKNKFENVDGICIEMEVKPNFRKWCGAVRDAIILAVVMFFVSASHGADKNAARAMADSLAVTMASETGRFPSFDSTTGVEVYLAIAAERNPELKSAYNGWVADLKKSDYAGSLPDPVFGYGYFIERVETRVGPQEHRFSFRQSFPWFGTLGAREDMAFAMAQASYRRYEAAGLEISYRVKAAYYDYYYLGRELQITRENFELLTFWESVAKSRYKVGLKKHPDVIKAQLELGKLEDRIRTLEKKREPIAARLRALLNLPDSVEIPIPHRISVDEARLLEDSVSRAIVMNNPNLQAMTYMIEREEARVSLATPSGSITLSPAMPSIRIWLRAARIPG
jgi:hypothetical protein